MTQEDKQLLLKDLCTRLPYGVKLKSKNGEVVTLVSPPTAIQDDCWNFKPYLRPISSMTKEEKNEFDILRQHDPYYEVNFDFIDWLNAHHFDYRNLIEKGLALKAPEGMYKTE